MERLTGLYYWTEKNFDNFKKLLKTYYFRVAYSASVYVFRGSFVFYSYFHFLSLAHF